MKSYIILLGSVILLALPERTKAQTRQVLDSVVIQDDRIPSRLAHSNRGIQVLSSQELRTLPVSSVPELLSYFAGMDLRQRGPGGVQADLSVDGSSFDQVLVLVNGMKVSDPQTGHHMLNLPIPLSSLERVEFIRGPAASQYGVNALAGVLNLITRVPESDALEASMLGGGLISGQDIEGSGYYHGGLRLNLSKRSQTMSQSIALSADHSTGYRHNTASRIIQAFYQNQWEWKQSRGLFFQAGFQDKDFGANGFYSAPGDRDSREKTQTLMAAMELQLGQRGRWSWTPRWSYRLHRDDYTYVRHDPALYRNQHQTHVFSAEGHGSRPIANGRLGIGLEYRQEMIRSNHLGNRQRGNLGAFTNLRQYWGRWDFSAGIYQNYHSQYGWQFFPSLDLGYRIIPSLKAFVHFGIGQRMPTYTDLYYEDPGNRGNENLRPERAFYLETGWRHSGSRGSIQATAFFRHTEDFIDWVREDSSQPWQPLNYQQVQVPGISLQIQGALIQGYLAQHRYSQEIHLNYTYLDPRIQGPDSRFSKYVIEALRHQLQLRWDHRLGENWVGSFTGRYQYRINMEDYWLLDCRIGYEKKKWSLYMDIRNLLDTYYREWGTVPLPGRWINFRLGFRLP